jgi:hypothetical protein
MKKIFYNKRHKVPEWSQIYIVWLVLFLIGIFAIGRWGIVKNQIELHGAYDYKKEYDIISNLHLKTLNAYPNVHEINKELLNKVHKEIHKFKWHFEEIDLNNNKFNCKFTRYYIENEKPNLVVLFDHDRLSNSFYFMHTLASAMIDENLHNLTTISVQGGPICAGFALKKYQGLASTRYLYVFTGMNKKPELQVINSTGSFSSILWADITPDSITHPDVFHQLAQGAVSLFQKSSFGDNAASVNGIGWVFPGEIKNEVNLIHTILPPLMFTLKNYNEISAKTTENSLWITKQSALSKRGVIALSIFLALLIWLPVANRLYQNESINHLVRSVLSAIYSSLVFFILAIFIKLGSSLMPVSTNGAFLIPLIFIVIHFFLDKAKKSIFDLSANSLTEFIVLNIFSSILVFYNFSLFVFLIPIIFAADKKTDSGSSAFKLLLILSLIPLMYAFYLVAASVGFENPGKLLSYAWIEKCIFANLTGAIIFFLWGGSLLSISRNSK